MKISVVFEYTNAPVIPTVIPKRQIITYVINAWKFEGPNDPTGSEQVGPSKVTAFQEPSNTVHIGDNENGSWRPIVTGIRMLSWI